MTPHERRTRMVVAAEIIEGVMLDFLEDEENRDSYFNTSQVDAGVGRVHYHLCAAALDRLHGRGRIDNHKTGRYNRWQARPY